jgi:hypothetical protein
MSKSINQWWQDMVDQVEIGSEVDPEQIDQMQQTFFAGFGSCLRGIHEMMANPEEAAKQIHSWNREMAAYALLQVFKGQHKAEREEPELPPFRRKYPPPSPE